LADTILKWIDRMSGWHLCWICVQMSVGQMSVGQMSVSQMYVGQMYVGQMSVGQMSVAQLPVGQMAFAQKARSCSYSQPFYEKKFHSQTKTFWHLSQPPTLSSLPPLSSLPLSPLSVFWPWIVAATVNHSVEVIETFIDLSWQPKCPNHKTWITKFVEIS